MPLLSILKRKEMDKAAIEKAMQDRAKGERTRVVFDLLMECIGAKMDIKASEVFEKVKEILQAESKAIQFLLPTQPMPNKGESPHEYVERMAERHPDFEPLQADESDGVSLSD